MNELCKQKFLTAENFLKMEVTDSHAETLFWKLRCVGNSKEKPL